MAKSYVICECFSLGCLREGYRSQTFPRSVMAAKSVASGAPSDCNMPIIVPHESFYKSTPSVLAISSVNMLEGCVTNRFLEPLQILMSMLLRLWLSTSHCHDSRHDIWRGEALLGAVRGHDELKTRPGMWSGVVEWTIHELQRDRSRKLRRI